MKVCKITRLAFTHLPKKFYVALQTKVCKITHQGV